MAAGSTVAVVLAVGRALGGAPAVVPWVGAAGVVVLVAALAALAFRVPPDRVARTIDRACGAAVPCSTAWMVARRGATNRVERALLGTVPTWSRQVDPRAVVPGVRVEHWLAAALPAWAAVAVAAMAPVPVLLEPSGAAQPSIASGEARLGPEDEEAAVKLERFADLLYREAAVRDDAAVGALAREAAELGERLRSGDVVAAQAWSSFAALADAVTASLGLANDPTYRAGDGAGDAAAGAGVRPGTNREQATPMLGQDRREDIGTTEAPREGERVLDSLLERLETDAIARATADAGTDVSDVSFRRGVGTTDGGNEFDSPYDDANADAPLDGAPSTSQARPDRGGAAAGDAAGAGGAEAGGMAGTWTEGRDPGRALDAFDVGLEALTLPDREPPGARRLRVLAPPPVALGAADDEGTAAPQPSGWRWSEEAFLGGHSLSARDRSDLAAALRPRSEGERD